MNRFSFLWIALAVLGVGLVCSAQAKEPASGTVYLRCGSLIDGKSDTARKNVVITIEGDKIQQVGAAPATGNVIDLSNETCLPGLIDTHTHVLLQGDITATDYDQQAVKTVPRVSNHFGDGKCPPGPGIRFYRIA